MVKGADDSGEGRNNCRPDRQKRIRQRFVTNRCQKKRSVGRAGYQAGDEDGRATRVSDPFLINAVQELKH
jgi:hypothetical protein